LFGGIYTRKIARRALSYSLSLPLDGARTLEGLRPPAG
jgi:hypothetical protein